MTIPLLHLNRLLCIGGATKVMENLAVLGDRSRFEPVLAGVQADEAYVQTLKARGIQAGPLGEDLSGLDRLIRPGKPFAVIVHRSGHADPVWDRVLPALRRAGAKVILERSIFGYADTGIGGRAIDLNCCNSLDTLRRLWHRCGRPDPEVYLKRHGVIYNPVVVGDRSACEKRGWEIREQLGIPRDAFVISTVTRPDPNKLDYILAAVFPRLAQKLGGVYLLARRLPDAIADPIRRSCGDRFVNLPASTDALDTLGTIAASDVMVHMSTIGESFGMAIAEAMSLGKPVITNETRQHSKSNAQGELIRHGESGYLYNDSYSVHRKICELYGDIQLRRRVGLAARERFASGSLSPEHVIGQWQREIAERMGPCSLGLTRNDESSSRVDPQAFRDYLVMRDGPGQSLPSSIPLADKHWAWKSDIQRLGYRIRRRFAA